MCELLRVVEQQAHQGVQDHPESMLHARAIQAETRRTERQTRQHVVSQDTAADRIAAGMEASALERRTTAMEKMAARRRWVAEWVVLRRI
jgi:hypothetical protein